MIHLLVCDDDPATLSYTKLLLQEYYGESANIITFSASIAALDYIKDGGSADIALLDILMPQMTGIELAKKLRDLNYNGQIIFLSSSNDFAAQSYAVDSLSYLLKPVNKDSLEAVLYKFDRVRHEDTAGFTVKIGKNIRRILFSSLVYAEVTDHTLHFHLLGDDVLSIRSSFVEYGPILLRDPRCAQCHRSYIVNLDYVERMEGKTLTMQTKDQFRITRSYADFGETYFKWIFNQEEQ